MKTFKSMLLAAAIGFAHTFATAQTPVQVYWPFSLASTHAAMVRTIVEDLNQAQKEYTFVFLHKPGAGGSIGANSLLDSKTPALMVATSSFFIRPNLYPENSHDLSKFKTLGSFCDNQPLALLSTRYKKLSDFNGKKINIGVIPGSITHLTAVSFDKSGKVDLNTVYYQGTPEMTKDVLGGHLDVAVDFLSSAEQFKNQVNVLSISGSKDINDFKTFSSQGIPGVTGTHANFIVFSAEADPHLIKTTQQALHKVLQSTKLQDLCKQEYGTPVVRVLDSDEAAKLYSSQVEYWKKQSQGITFKK